MLKPFIVLRLLLLMALGVPMAGYAQNPTDDLPGDPGLISIAKYRDMSFGSFSQGNSGGTVVLSNTGSRSSSGTVFLLNLGASWYHAIFEIEAPQNTLISVSTSNSATLMGSNGGSMTLLLGATNLGSPFVSAQSPPAKTQLFIGGTLNVGNVTAAPPGNYSGTFYVTINNE